MKFYPNSAISATGNKAGMNNLDKFLDWWAGHQAFCKVNYSGSSTAMESEGARTIWK